jgi:hypothetical protein
MRSPSGSRLVRVAAGPNPIQTRVSDSTGFCLDVPGAQTTPGLQLQTWRCNGTLAQQFWVAQ